MSVAHNASVRTSSNHHPKEALTYVLRLVTNRIYLLYDAVSHLDIFASDSKTLMATTYFNHVAVSHIEQRIREFD